MSRATPKTEYFIVEDSLTKPRVFLKVECVKNVRSVRNLNCNTTFWSSVRGGNLNTYTLSIVFVFIFC